MTLRLGALDLVSKSFLPCRTASHLSEKDKFQQKEEAAIAYSLHLCGILRKRGSISWTPILNDKANAILIFEKYCLLPYETTKAKELLTTAGTRLYLTP